MNLNKTMLAGRLTRDPELKYTANGTAVCDLGLAVNERVKKRDDYEDKPVFIDVTAWKGAAEFAGKYLKKGSLVLIEGRLEFEQWEDKETGQKRSKLKVVARTVQSLREGQPKSQQPASQPAAATAGGAGEDEDDIPF